MVLQHNITAMFTNKQLGITTKDQAKSAEKLSTGYRINRAADDAAGLTISENMRRQIRGLNKGSRNSQDGISYCQVADGAMGEMSSIIHRVKELCVQGANDTNTDADREAIQQEIDNLSEEIGNILDHTQFNTLDVFGRDRELTVTKVDANGEKIISTSVVPVEGNNYGLGEILGKDAISSGTNMDSVFKLTNGYNSTGVMSTTYKNNRLGELADICSSILGRKCTEENLKGYNWLRYQTGVTPEGDNILNLSDPPKKYTFTYTDILNGGKSLVSAVCTDTITGKTTDYGSLDIGAGNKPLANKEYNSSWLDFKDANKVPGGFQVTDLYNQGFNVGCAGDAGCYSIMFTDGSDGSDPYSYEEGSCRLLKVNIKSAENMQPPAQNPGEEIVKRVIEAINRTDFHSGYAQFVHSNTPPENTKLYIVDNRGADYPQGTFELVSRDTNGHQVSSDSVTRTEKALDGSMTIYSYEDKHLWIQSGDLEQSGLMIKKEWLTRTNIGLDRIAVKDFESASSGITICDLALDKVSSARANMGAYMNRLEYAVAVADNTSENVQSSESKIRDTDMADEMVAYSKANILSQAGQSVLAQANQSTQGILQLLQ